MNDLNVTWMTPTGKEAAFIAYLNAAGFATEPDTVEELMERHVND